MPDYPYVVGGEKVHDPALTSEATRLARLADKKASRDPWQEGAAAHTTEVLMTETHPDLLDSSVPNDVLKATEAHGALGGTHFPENTPTDDVQEATAAPVVVEAAVDAPKPVVAKKAAGAGKAKK